MNDTNEANGHQFFGGFASLTALILVLGYFCF